MTDSMIETIDFNMKIQLLRKQVCFTPLTEKEIEVLASLLIEKHIPEGTVIVKQGDPVDSVYLIASGKADVSITEIKDNQLHTKSVATLSDNAAIGLNETGFYSISGIRTATVTSLTEMTLLRLSVAAFHGFALAYTHVNEVMRLHAEKIIGSSSSEI